MSSVLPFKPARVKRGESRLIYIAAPFHAREEARELKDLLEAAGHVVTSTWITSHLDNYADLSSEELSHEANHDAEGVGRCEILILLNNAGLSTMGGMHVELGLAIAWNKRVMIIGEPSNLFHHLPGIKTVRSSTEAVEMVNRYFPRPQSPTGASHEHA